MKTLEWVGCAFGLAGTLIAALNADWIFWTFVVWMISNMCWIAAGVLRKQKALVIQMLGFSIAGVVGLVNHFPSEEVGCFMKRDLPDWMQSSECLSPADQLKYWGGQSE